IPLATDHYGLIGIEEVIKLANRLEKFNLAWFEEVVAWQYTDQCKRMSEMTTIPLCFGENNYLKESFLPLLECGAASVVHPDILTAGGLLETKKIGDMSQDYGARMALHMAASPIAAMASVQVAAAT